jgi:hypothetical protein
VREIDPFRRIVTIHPTAIGRDQVEDDGVLDFDMLQTGHSGIDSAPNNLKKVSEEYSRKPTMPVVVSEVNYEGIIHGTQDEIQRLMFWQSVLSGAAGYTYGANGIWQVNTRLKQFGPSPHGSNWGITPWEDAYQLPGSQQLGLASKLLGQFPWWRFEPHQEWIEPCGSLENVKAPYAAGIPKEIRLIYFYAPCRPTVTMIEPEIVYQAIFWDPRTGKAHNLGSVEPNSDGQWSAPEQPYMSDWLLILDAIGACDPLLKCEV